jgi:5-enolpyruvylshikimate-3-phosphate synthase
MSAAIAGAFSRNGVSISDPLCVNKSYPGFFNDLISAGGVVDGFDNW